MSDDNEIETGEDASADLRSTIAAAVEEHSAPTEKTDAPAVEPPEKPVVEKAAKARDEKGKFAKSEAEAAAAVEPPAKVREAPFGWSAENKAKFNALPPEIQDQVLLREDETHKTITKHDEERNLGKSMKEVIAPYMAIIQSEGGTPQGAVKDLLNTAYILRTGSPVQKLAVMQQVAQQYGIDLRQVAQAPAQQNVDPNISALQKQVQDLQAHINNQSALHKQSEDAKIQSLYQAFAAKPENVHFSNPKVQAFMATVLNGGHAESYQDAYDQAIYAIPEIRSTLTPVQQVDQAKRQQEVQAKKKAGSSISGGPGLSVANTGNPTRDLREEIAHNLAASRH
jgi:hypothetical protein